MSLSMMMWEGRGSSSSNNANERRREGDERVAAASDLLSLSSDTESSVAQIKAQMSSWTSSRLSSSTQPSSYRNWSSQQQQDEDEVRFMKDVLENEKLDENEEYVEEDDEDGVAMIMVGQDGSFSSPSDRSISKRVSQAALGLERADTPVHSNSKRSADSDEKTLIKKKKNESITTSTTSTPSPNIHTPFQQGNKDIMSSSSASYARSLIPIKTKNTPYSIRKSSLPHNILTLEDRQQVQLCQEYHDALFHFLQAERRWTERYDLASTSAAMVEIPTTTTNNNNNNAHPHHLLLREEHDNIHLQFLKQMTEIAYHHHHHHPDDKAQHFFSKEANFWNLLWHLRKLGMDALLWRPEETSIQQNRTLLEDTILLLQQQQQQGQRLSPWQILQILQQPPPPKSTQTTSIIQRRYQLLAWIQDCFRRQLPFTLHNNNKRDVSATKNDHPISYKKNSKLSAEQGLAETEQDSTLLRQSLALILAGRLSQAQDLMRSHGLSWRAAVWGGGKPDGYEDNKTLFRVGNPRRALWQCMLWKQQQQQQQGESAASHEERAIASLLCNNVKSSFANPVLRTWEKALLVGLKAIVGRLEDVVLYRHLANNNKFARTHLDNTEDMADMDEMTLVNTLASTPYPEMQSHDLFSTATAAFLVGQTAIKALLQTMEKNLQDKTDGHDFKIKLRFVAHVVLYLDSTMSDPAARVITAPLQWDLKRIKDLLVVDYLQSLAEREMWTLLVLYATLLSQDLMLQHLPPLLAHVTNFKDQQKAVVSQLREILPNFELQILQAIVKQHEKKIPPLLTNDQERLDDLEIADRDEMMMEALTWFCVFSDHALEALLYSNSLIRKFLTQGKLDTVFRFVEQYPPKDLLEKIRNSSQEDEEMLDASTRQDLDQALWEYDAYQLYLKAERAFNEWKVSLDRACSEKSEIPTRNNMEVWNERELSIAISEERRQRIQQKRLLAEPIIVAADAARQALDAVLKYPKGWLQTAENESKENIHNYQQVDEEKEVDDDENMSEIQGDDVDYKTLRKKVLSHVVLLHETVCGETAEFMEQLLQQLVSRLPRTDAVETMRSVLLLLDSDALAASSGNETRQSAFSPTYWTQQAMSLADTLASDEYNIPVDEVALEQMTKITVSHLQYSVDLEEEPGL